VRIGLNLLHAQPGIGGGWTYIAELLAALGKCDTGNTYVAFVTGASECLVPRSGNTERVIIDIRHASRPWRVAYESSMLQLQAVRRNVDLMHWFSATHAWFNSVPSAVTFYDLQAFLKPARFPFAKRRYLQTAIRRTVRRSQALLPISRSTAADMCVTLGASRERITVIPPVVPSSFGVADRESTAKFRRRYGLPGRYWLCVAHYYPHKNHHALLRAYRRLRDTGAPTWPLVLRGDPAGAEREIEAALSELGLRDSVLQLARLPRSEMPSLYAAASGFVFPSVYEGCGIPVLEAMSCGCPIAASDIAASREFAGRAALYFDPTDEASIAGAMREMQDSAALRRQLQAEGLRRAERSRPDAVAPQLMQAYRRAVSASVPVN
jgi:glycosyltransferase involved in cell wall biosynthesis